MVHHMGEAGNKDFIVRSEQALWAQDSKASLRVGLGEQRNHLFTSRFAAGEFVGEAMGTEVFFDIAMMVIIKIQRRRGDMNKVTYAPGYGPLAQTAGSTNVGQIKSFLSSPWRGETGAVPQRVNAGQHHFCLRRNQLGQIRMHKLCAHFLQQLAHRFVATGGSDADAFAA